MMRMMRKRAPVYDEHFYDEMNERVLMSAKTVVPAVLNMLQPQSVVDVGCGIGTWLSVFRACGVETVLGIDGDYINRSKLLIPSSSFMSMNLAEPFVLPQRFDLAVSLEVAEHLPPQCASSFVSSLCRSAPAVLFSAAVPGQGGEHHVNEQWPEYWRRLFATHEFGMFDALRPSLWYDETVAVCYRQNLFLFFSKTLLDSRPALRHFPEVKDETGLMLISPQIAFDQMGLRATVKRLPRLVREVIARRFHSVMSIGPAAAMFERRHG